MRSGLSMAPSLGFGDRPQDGGQELPNLLIPQEPVVMAVLLVILGR